MTHLPIPVPDLGGSYVSPPVVRLGAAAPRVGELFSFMRDAEGRFETLRLRIVDRTYGASGEDREIVELWLRHPGHAKVVTRRDDSAIRGHFDVWITDGSDVRTYDARAGTASIRRARPILRGADEPDLPPRARLYHPVTDLPMETLAETFVHPNGYCRNVLATGRCEVLGSTRLAGGRESFLLRCEQPRTSHLLTDRPDHWIELGVDRMTGLILMLAEGVGERVTRHAEVTDLSLDERIGDEAFELHLSSDVRMMY